jgi:hypothetical protein
MIFDFLKATLANPLNPVCRPKKSCFKGSRGFDRTDTSKLNRKIESLCGAHKIIYFFALYFFILCL